MIALLVAGCLPAPTPPAPGDPGHDYDDDGYSEDDGDCDDRDAAIHPGVDEVCEDDLDNDCDGTPGPCGLWGDIAAADADATLYASDASVYAGSALDASRDIDRDGRAELLVGAPNPDGGRVHLVLPGSSGDLGGTVFHGAVPGDWFGVALAWVDDIDGDELPDLAVGAPGGAIEVDPHTAGTVYLFAAPAGTDVGADEAFVRIHGEPGSAIGTRIAGGDLDGDGHGDLLVGAEYADPGGRTDAGAVYVVRGPIAGDLDLTAADAILVGQDEDGSLGLSLLPPLDVDGDGTAEVVAGAPGAAYEDVLPGLVYVFRGDLAGADPLARLSGSADEDRVGQSIAATDTDGDGHVDLVVGSPSAREQERGYVYVVAGPIVADVELDYADARLVGEAPHDDLGEAVCAPGDVDGDGLGDLLVSSEDHETTPSDAGIAYLVLGGRSGTFSMTDADARIVGSERQAFGKALAGGDLDGDGYADLVVGAPLASFGLARGGAAMVFSGGAP